MNRGFTDKYALSANLMPGKVLGVVNRTKNAEMRGKKSCLCGEYILMKEDREKTKIYVNYRV